MSHSKSFNPFRKIFHLAGLLIPLCFYLDLFRGWKGYMYASKIAVSGFLLFSIGILILAEVLRFFFPPFSKLFWKIFGLIMKKEEEGRMNATIPYFVATLFVVLFLPAELATMSMLLLIVGDPSAAYFGSNYGKRRFYNGKSLEGILGFLGAGIFFGVLLLMIFSFTAGGSKYGILYQNQFQWQSIVLLLSGAIIAALSEFFSSTALYGFWDDNLLIPVCSGIGMGLLASPLYNLPMESVWFPIQNLLLMDPSGQSVFHF
jgi:dolichol kinase